MTELFKCDFLPDTKNDERGSCILGLKDAEFNKDGFIHKLKSEDEHLRKDRVDEDLLWDDLEDDEYSVEDWEKAFADRVLNDPALIAERAAVQESFEPTPRELLQDRIIWWELRASALLMVALWVLMGVRLWYGLEVF